jgi:hypothetical protein
MRLASAGSVTFRITPSGCGGVSIVSAKVSVQFVPPPSPTLVSEGSCGRWRRMRIAWPFSSGNWLTSAMTAPPLLRIGSTSIGFMESNTSHTVSARRNSAAGAAVAKENFRRRPSLSRWASTEAAPSPAFASGGGSGAATATFGATSAIGVFAGASATGAAISLAGRAGAAVSGAGAAFGADPGLISILACSAMLSEVGGAIPPIFHNGDVSRAGLSGAAGAAATGATATGAAGTAAIGA